jgi:pyruvate formate lyase activating enzyme
MKECILFKELLERTVQCTACNHYCTIPKGKLGICGVRKNIDGKLFLLTYGKAPAHGIDPIEKKPLFHFFPGTQIFSFGTFGCNYSCSFCQNSELSQCTKEKELVNFGPMFPPEKIVEYCKKENIPSIAYTYNEPAIFFEYAYDTAKLAHEAGLKNVFVSNGYESKEALEKITPYLDAINIDIKSFSNEFYSKNCKARLQPVLDTVKLAHELGIWVEVTTLVIPKENDSKKELAQIAEFIASVSRNIPWHVTRFYPNYLMTDRDSTPIKTLLDAHNAGKKAGLNYVYIGNIKNEFESTLCPKCGKVLVERKGFLVQKNNLFNGKCSCGEKIAGVWE